MLLKYLPTTFFLLSWCLAFALLWLSICLLLLKAGHIRLLKLCHRPLLFLPAMIIAPLLLTLVFRGVGINLLFPIHLFARTSELLIAAAVPGLVLFFASGMPHLLLRGVVTEQEFWQDKTFVTFGAALGLPVERHLRRLIFLRSFLTGLNGALPWIFGELIIVEVIFNAPGLGYDAWQLARARDFEALSVAVGALALIYATSMLLSTAGSRWLGRRLESYA